MVILGGVGKDTIDKINTETIPKVEHAVSDAELQAELIFNRLLDRINGTRVYLRTNDQGMYLELAVPPV